MGYSRTEGAQGICPSGWHIPTDAEWFILEHHIDATLTDLISTGWRSNIAWVQNLNSEAILAFMLTWQTTEKKMETFLISEVPYFIGHQQKQIIFRHISDRYL